jgi:hypothetical protein
MAQISKKLYKIDKNANCEHKKVPKVIFEH